MLNLILIRHRHDGDCTRHSFHARWHFALLGLAAMFFVGAVGSAGYLVAEAMQEAPPGDSWRIDLASQQDRIAERRDETRGELRALTQRLGELQGRVARLDALGRRLVEESGIDSGEFAFAETPGLGGPLVGGSEQEWLRPAAVDDALERLSHRLEDRENQLSVLDDVLADRRLDAASRPIGQPIDQGWMSSNYGYRKDPFTGRRTWHDGVDFAGREGSPIRALGAGVVTYAGRRPGYGMLVEIVHGNGYVTRYGHNAEVLVEAGRVVDRGDRIATMGSTGRSTGPHVHLEIEKDGESVNPWQYVQAER